LPHAWIGCWGTLTWQVPWVELVDVDVGDDGDRARRVAGAVAEVVEDQLLVRRVKPEAGRQHRRVRHDHYSPTRTRSIEQASDDGSNRTPSPKSPSSYPPYKAFAPMRRKEREALDLLDRSSLEKRGSGGILGNGRGEPAYMHAVRGAGPRRQSREASPGLPPNGSGGVRGYRLMSSFLASRTRVRRDATGAGGRGWTP
jgi:hypothetical protein